MDGWKDWFDWFDLGGWAAGLIEWLRSALSPVFTFIRDALFGAYNQLFELLNLPPSLVMIALLALAGGFARSWRFALASVVSLLLVDLMGQWQNAMQTLALVIVAVVVAAALGIPIGIAAARSPLVGNLTKPVLDFMQTMPSFVYLLLAVVIFRIGRVPGVMSAVIFATPPAVRLTELGIRQVDKEVVEAAEAFGARPREVLTGVQLPLARASIMAGVNQVIMLALSMVVIAGLGGTVVRAVTSVNIPMGIEGGLGVVILAIYLDRITAAFGAEGRGRRSGDAASDEQAPSQEPEADDAVASDREPEHQTSAV
jgi:glycine betaine/proline transport system permease protein